MPMSLEDAQALDAADPLRGFRSQFQLPDGFIYLDGNSLGAAPKATFDEIDQAMRHEWAEDLITSWNKAGWFSLVTELGDQLAKLIGAGAGEVVVCDTVSTNIFKLLHAALGLRPDRKVIVGEGHCFPTDLYMSEGVAATASGVQLRMQGVDGDRLEDLIDDTVAVALINHVDYRTGELRDMAALTKIAHDAGALVIWDLCHSAGALPVDLNGAEADFAVGCTYKYLNGGPGAPGFIFAAQRHLAEVTQPLSGWWGHAAPFAFERGYRGDAGIRKFLCGTQPILSLRAVKPALDIFSQADMGALRTKSQALGNLFIDLVEERCAGHGLSLTCPRDADRRGSQVSFSHEEAYAILQALIADDVIGDFRAPNVMRFGFAPLYVGYADVWRAVDRLVHILESGIWQNERFHQRGAVT